VGTNPDSPVIVPIMFHRQIRNIAGNARFSDSRAARHVLEAILPGME